VDSGSDTNNTKKGHSHLTLGGIAANILSGGRGSHMGSLMVPLNRALLSFCRLSIATILLSVTVWLQSAMQILTGGPSPKSPLPMGGPEHCLIKCYLGPH